MTRITTRNGTRAARITQLPAARFTVRGGGAPSVRYSARWRSLPVEGTRHGPKAPSALLGCLLGLFA